METETETETEKLAASEARAVDDKHPKINNRTTDRGAVFSRTERQRRALDAASDYFPHTHTSTEKHTQTHTNTHAFSARTVGRRRRDIWEYCAKSVKTREREMALSATWFRGQSLNMAMVVKQTLLSLAN